MYRSIFTNSIGILVSRVLGFIRDMMTASVLGANIFSDIFFIAFKLPNLFRRIFAEGAFTQSFLPAFTNTAKKGLFVARITLTFSVILAIITLFVMVFAKESTSLIALGFDDATVTLAAPYVRINFIYLILIFWVTFFTALLHYKHHFATSAFSTALLNLAMIGALMLSKDRTPDIIVYFLSYGVIFGGILQLIVHIVAIKHKGLFPLVFGGFKYFKSPRHRAQSTKDVKEFKSNFLPAVWGNSTAQVSAFLDTWLASFLVAGSISYLYYANRVFQLPLALFAIATSMALFPSIAKAMKNSDMNKARQHLKRAFWFLLTLLSLATLGGVILSEEIVWFLFERGAFTSQDRLVTADVLVMYLIGLLPFGLAKLFVLFIYAKQQQRQAATIATISLGVNIVLSLAFIVPLKAPGLALASTISGFVYLFLTLKAFSLKEFNTLLFDKKLLYLLTLLLFFTLLLLVIHHYTAPFLVVKA